MARNTRTVLELRAGSLAETDVEVFRVTGREALSEPFRFDVEFRTKAADPLSLSSLIGQEAQLAIRPARGEARIVHGVVEVAELAGVDAARPRYRLRVVPRLALLAHSCDSRIFQRLSVPDIVARILDDGAVDHAAKLRSSHPAREYCVQYRESDLAFVSRLLEEEGIFYWFEHADGQHVLTLADQNDACSAIADDAEVPWRPPDLADDGSEGEHVFALALARRVRPDKSSLRDFDFERPALDLTATSGRGNLEVYSYPGGYVALGEGKRLAKLRLEELGMFAEIFAGASTCTRLVPGCTFEVVHHPDAALDGQLVIVSVTHEMRQAPAAAGPASIDHHYENSFTAVARSVPCRPARRSRRRVFPGAQTATVVGPPNEEIHDDGHQRIKVQFHWDREGRRDDGASCWVRVAQRWAGAGFGASYVPRIGQEVVVRFLDGDPDRPLVTGAVYNAQNPPPIPLPHDRTQSTLRSDSSPGGGGANELRFEDQAGVEKVELHAEKDERIEVENDKAQQVRGNDSLTVAKDRSIAVHQNQALQVSEVDTLRIGANETLTVGGSRETRVAANHTERILGNQAVTVGGEQNVMAEAAGATTVGAAAALSVGAGYAVSVGGALNIAAGGARSIEVGGEMLEVVGAARSETIAKDASRKVADDCEVEVKGQVSSVTSKELKEDVDGKAGVEVKEPVTMVAKKLQIEASNELQLAVGGDVMLTVKSGGEVSFAPKAMTVKGSAQITMKGGKVKKDASESAAAANAQVKQLQALKRTSALVEFSLVDRNDHPLAREPFAVQLPDGTVKRGVTDEKGRAKVAAPQEGNCSVTFPWADRHDADPDDGGAGGNSGAGRRNVTPSDLTSGVQLATGRAVVLAVPAWHDEPGVLDFTLRSDLGLSSRQCKFHVEGHGIDLDGETDVNGHFRHEPVPMGEYLLTVGDASFSIPACAAGTPPHVVHVPHHSIPDVRNGWKNPTPEEQSESDGGTGGSAP